MEIEEYTQEIPTELMELLLTADPDSASVRSYLPGGRIMVCIEEGVCVGVAVLTKRGSVFELKNIAVKTDYQGQGIAKRLIGETMSLAKRMGATDIEVGTGNSSLAQLALYQKCGFRMTSIERGFFAAYPEPIIENGIRCIDMVRLRAPL